MFNKIWTKITHSKIVYYFWELKYKIAFGYLRWLLKINGITAPSNKDVLWHYLLGQLSTEAQNRGIAVKHLYIIHNSFIKIRGFTLMSIAGDEDVIQKFCDLNAKEEPYQILEGLIQLPILNASNWNQHSSNEKQELIKFFNNNSFKLWCEIKKSCETLSQSWQANKDISTNIAIQSFSILGAVFFSLKQVPEEIIPLIVQFERIWGNPQKFSAHELSENVRKFKDISKKLHAQRKEVVLPASDLLKILFQSHQARVYGLETPEDINIAAYFAFFENLPKAILGLFVLVFAEEKWLNRLQAERERLSNELGAQNLTAESEKGFRYIVTHSELFDRLWMEVMRYWCPAPVLPRINTNLLVNSLFSYGEDRALTENVELPPRSIAIVSQFQIARSSRWKDPNKFDPDRSEYKFKDDLKGTTCTHGRPLVQAEPRSVRRCPFTRPAKSYFYGMLWWFPYKLSFTTEQREQLEKTLSKDEFYRPLVGSSTIPVRLTRL